MGFKWIVHPQDNTGMCVRKTDMSDSYLQSLNTIKHLQKEKVLRHLGVYMMSVSSECGITMVIRQKPPFLHKITRGESVDLLWLMYVTQDAELNLLWGT